MALGVGIGEVRAADLLYLVQQGAIGQDRPAQIRPIAPSTACDHVVDGGVSETLMVEMAMQHIERHTFDDFAIPDESRFFYISYETKQHDFPTGAACTMSTGWASLAGTCASVVSAFPFAPHQPSLAPSTIVADRLCGSVANPIIRNAQEKRQLASIQEWLERRGYKQNPPGDGTKFNAMTPGTFSFRLNVPVSQEDTGKQVNIPVDAVIMPKTAKAGDFPLLVEAKSAGDFTNVNKRRKEEATKMAQLRRTYGARVRFILFLCGYFDSGYLGYEAAEGIDWVWEHRIDDLAEFGI